MKKFILALTLLAAPAHAEVVAVVNGENITREQVDKALEGIEWAEGDKAKLDKLPRDIQKSFIDKYIERKLIIDAARKAGVDKTPEIVAKLKAAEEVLIQQKYLLNLVESQKTMPKLKEVYNETYGKKGGQEELKASHILVKTKEEAEKIKAELAKGGNFEKIAKEKSIDPGAKLSGGDLGYFVADDMVPDFSKAAFAMKKGEISDPIQTQFGWHIIKLIDRRQQKVVRFMDVKSQVEQEFAVRTIQAKVDEIKKSAKIEYKGDYATTAAPAAPAKAVEPKKVPVKTNINKPATTATPAAAKPAPAAAPAKPAAAAPAPAATKPVEKK